MTTIVLTNETDAYNCLSGDLLFLMNRTYTTLLLKDRNVPK